MSVNHEILGELIGQGNTRQVYQHATQKDLVIKIPVGFDGANKKEWRLWNKYKDSPVGNFMCPCVEYVSGKYLIMEKCKPLTGIPRTVVLERVAQMRSLGFRDVRKCNLGLYKDRIVLLDYGHSKTNVVYFNLQDLKLASISPVPIHVKE